MVSTMQPPPTTVDSTPGLRLGPIRRFAVWFLFWTGIGLAFAFQLQLTSSKLGQPIAWARAVSWSLADWYVYAALALLASPLAARLRLSSTSWPWTVPIHLSASLVFSLLYILLRAAVGLIQARSSGQPVGFEAVFEPLLTKTFLFNTLVYWVLVLSLHAKAYYAEALERQRHSAELERRLVEARLQALQMQLNPHFLFNTLNAISALMHQDVEAADRMVSRLSDLLRYALESAGTQLVPLRQELDFLERYLDIERVRFGTRLTVRFAVPPEVLPIPVPNLLLQPLVENAIRHGLAPYARPGFLDISGRLEGSRLILEVADNGGGLDSKNPKTKGNGIGLANTRARLRELYGEDHEFELVDRDGGGASARLSLPIRGATSAVTP